MNTRNELEGLVLASLSSLV